MPSPRAFRPASAPLTLARRLAAFPFLGELDSESLEKMASRARALSFAEETPFVHTGAPVQAVPLVERGGIRVERIEPDGRRITLYRVRPGESCVLALSGAIRDEPYPAEAIAEARTEMIVVPTETLRQVFEEQTSLRSFVLELYSARLFDLMHLVQQVRFERLETRLARLLLQESRSAPGVLQPVALSHAELAARLGTAREVVSRALGAMRESGAVALHRGRIEVLDDDALRALASG